MKGIQLLLVLCCLSITAISQKIFSEGSIRYDIYLDGSTQPDGIYVVSVKGGMLKRELAMNNGFNNVTIYNQKTGKTISLNANDEQHYALEISESELKEKNKRFENAKLTETSDRKKIAGYSCKGMQVQYSNQSGNTIYFTSDLLPPNETFNTMFPGLNGIPLEYETKASSGTMRFVASVVEIKSLDSNLFTIPASYKIVTKEELNKMK